MAVQFASKCIEVHKSTYSTTLGNICSVKQKETTTLHCRRGGGGGEVHIYCLIGESEITTGVLYTPKHNNK